MVEVHATPDKTDGWDNVWDEFSPGIAAIRETALRLALDCTGFNTSLLVHVEGQAWRLDRLAGDDLGLAQGQTFFAPESALGRLTSADQPIVIEDVRRTPGFAESAQIFGPDVRAFVCVPLSGPGRDVNGLLCALSREPRAVTPAVIASLRGVARLLADAMLRDYEVEGLRRRNYQLANIIDLSNDGVVTIDANGVVTEFSPAAERIFGWSAEEIIGHTIDHLFPERLHETLRARIAEFGQSGRTRLEMGITRPFVGLRKNGEEFPFESSVLKHELGDTWQSTIVYRDITEREREQAKERLAAIVDAADDAIIGKTLDGTIISWNRGAEHLFGYPANEAIGRPISLVIPTGELDRETELLSRIARGERVDSHETVRITRDGRLVHVSVAASPIMDASGAVSGASTIARDITARKQAEAERDRFFTLSLDLLGIAGFDGYFKRINPAFAQTLGFSEDEILTTPFLEFVHPDDREATMAETAKQLSAGLPTANFENRYRCKDGSYRWLSWKATPADGLVYAVARDVTERRHTEEALRTANRELESFSYSISHDLRAPLRGIDGFSRILLEDYGPSLPAEARRYLGIIRDGTVNMGQLIDDLLAFSRLSRQPLRTRTVDPGQIARTVFEELQAETGGREITFKLEPLPPCRADPALLKQVFSNLVGNALKYSRGREPAVIEIGAVEDGSLFGQHTYFVKDNGVGFDMAYVHKLFGVFQRLHRAEDYEGTGVGLAIVQRIVHRHGGVVRAEGTLNQGAAFFFTMPAAISSSFPAPDAGASHGDPADRRGQR